MEVITDCCSKTYLDMMKHTAMSSSSWNLKYPINLEPKHLKLDIIENEPLEPIFARPVGQYEHCRHILIHADSRSNQVFSVDNHVH